MALSLHHVSLCDQFWAQGDVVDVTTPGCISEKGVPLSVGLRGTIMATRILCYVLDNTDDCRHDFRDGPLVDSRQVSRSAGDVFFTL